MITVNIFFFNDTATTEIYTDRFYVGLRHARETIQAAGLKETTEAALLSE